MSIRMRATAIAFAVLIHGFGAYLFVSMLRVVRTPSSTEQRALEIFFVAPRVEPVAIKKQPYRKERPAPTSAITIVAPEVPSQPPIIDFNAAREAAVSAIARQSIGSSTERSLDSKPSAIQPPTQRPTHRTGESHRLDSGELITWVDEQCYVTNMPAAGPQLDEKAIRVVCKDPFQGRTDLFDHLRPSYLGRPTEEAKKKLAAGDND